MGGSKPTRTDRPFGCPWPPCEKYFGTRTHLNRHINDKHDRKKIFPCTVVGCHRVFTQAGNMRLHVKTHEKRDVLPDVEMASGASDAAPVTNDSGTRERSTTERSSSGSWSLAFSQLTLECAHAGAPGVALGSTCITSDTDGPRISSTEFHEPDVTSSFFHHTAGSPPQAGWDAPYPPHQTYPEVVIPISPMNEDQYLAAINDLFSFVYGQPTPLSDFHHMDPSVPSNNAGFVQCTAAPHPETSSNYDLIHQDESISFIFVDGATPQARVRARL
ncbi:hypothetical protein BOTBODRAFT_191103 [Botryobasidium botryosum FD-172 SS1]|uniref:C2H2-type domain-containing protein n=1 Tax=Botryobasidium botryosum (strain FD-172 SS1) TaxID=930990 RepID=A0A067MC76_BOTB1|nr:hypothetical protein BOTBODRAFT_191103 [Botryobasidium botryosum FD-172 SS1]